MDIRYEQNRNGLARLGFEKGQGHLVSDQKGRVQTNQGLTVAEVHLEQILRPLGTGRALRVDVVR